MFASMRIGTRLAAGFGVVVVLFIVLLVTIGMATSELKQGVEQIDKETLPYILVVDEMDTHRVDVQQFLTDVSATHNTGGYKEAEAAAKDFRDGVAQYRRMFQAENDKTGHEKLDAIESAFNKYYETGRVMAEIYVAQMAEENSAATASVSAQAIALGDFADVLNRSVNRFRV